MASAGKFTHSTLEVNILSLEVFHNQSTDRSVGYVNDSILCHERRYVSFRAAAGGVLIGSERLSPLAILHRHRNVSSTGVARGWRPPATTVVLNPLREADMAVFFHGSFGLDRSRMARLLARGLNKPDLGDAALAKPFGYGAPFATRYRAWLNKSGMIGGGLPMRLTNLGGVVWQHDPQLEHTVTKWYLHHSLTADPESAEAWYFFVREFLPKKKSFNREELMRGLMMKLRSHSEKHFGPKSTMNPVIARKLMECYVESAALGDLGLISKEGKGSYLVNEPRVRGPWPTPSKLAQAYPR